MELGLSLGDASKPFDFMPKSNPHHHHLHRNNTNTATATATATNLGSCMALSIGSKSQPHEPQQHFSEKNILPSQNDADVENDVVQLDLLPRTPLPVNQTGEIGLFKTRGFDVNRLPEQSVAEEEMSSSPSRNSGASSFQMDLCMYNGGGGGGGSGNKRGSAELLGGGGDGENDDEDGSTRKKLRLSKTQSAFLEESFKEHNTLNPKQKLALAKQLNLRPRQVEVWFQNRRARTKLKQTEVDCEYLKRCCETLTEENRRLHKELQELRTLKSSNSNPFYMQLPATTLTMCPSCERVATTSATATTSNTAATNKQAPFSVARPKFQTFSSQQQQTHFPNQSKAS